MSALQPMFDSHDLVPPLNPQEAETAAGELAAASGLTVYPRSIVARDGVVYFLGRRVKEKLLCALAKQTVVGLEGEEVPCLSGTLRICPRSASNAALLRKTLPYLAPTLAGLRRSLGMGDRLGLATPGHLRAIRGSGVFPVLAQQSMREMNRTQRTPQEVLDDAMWGVFEEGYREGYGSDADHLKTVEDIHQCFAAGFRMFTVDPGEFVDNAADKDDAAALEQKTDALPWEQLETTFADFEKTYAGQSFRIGYDMELAFSREQALRAAAKYGRAIAHTVKLYRHAQDMAQGTPVEFEMSVDETETPTTVLEHYYIAKELARLKVKVVSLAPRFIGDFEKGVDYKGDLKAFEDAFIQHVKIARLLGPYKISIHSGSDKFSIYKIAARHARDLIHVKTAGTSYLEATRAIAAIAPKLFREIFAFALQRYPEDKASYHVSADLGSLPHPEALKDEELPPILDGNAGRQVLHVTYGSVLTTKDVSGSLLFRDRFLEALRTNEEVYYEIVARHMRRHVEPFAISQG